MPILLFILLALIPPVAGGDSNCEENLIQARQHFRLGRFERVPALLEPCRGRALPLATRMETLVLLASTYLAGDEKNKARPYVEELLQLNADYNWRQTPPKPFAHSGRPSRKSEPAWNGP